MSVYDMEPTRGHMCGKGRCEVFESAPMDAIKPALDEWRHAYKRQHGDWPTLDEQVEKIVELDEAWRARRKILRDSRPA